MGDCPSPAGPWLDKARQDLAAAERLLTEPALPAPACFHAQQAAEKALKAVAAHAGAQDIPRVHSLLEIAAIVQSLNQDVPFAADDLASLDPFAVQVRYPDLPEPGAEIARQAVETAQAVCLWAAETISHTEVEEE
ncbi:MAG: HEPN domain-containing protein [Armatimonadota bacterium]